MAEDLGMAGGREGVMAGGREGGREGWPKRIKGGT